MADRFAPWLINGAFEDPVLFIAFQYERRAMLFDLGRLDRLSVREILKLTHIDHFIGLDHLLRCSLNRQQELRLYGPVGFIDNVQGKLSGYTWNLNRDYPVVLTVHEIQGEMMRRVGFKAAHEFRMQGEAISEFSGTLLDERGRCVRATILDHQIPCLAFSLEESNGSTAAVVMLLDVLHVDGLSSPLLSVNRNT
jgi:ribonuclease Z